MIYLTGDINLTDNSFDVGYGVGSAIKRGINPFHNIQKSENDIWIGNFEGVTSYTSDCQGYRKNSFRIKPEYIKNLGLIDFWGVANNHVMEHGVIAFHEMEEILSLSSKGTFGSKRKHSVIFEHNGQTVSITGFSLRNDQLNEKPQYWNFPNMDELRSEYGKIRTSDLKIAYVHWGVEFIDYPNWEQRMIGHWLVDLGFDIIIGMHPHVLQGYEKYKGKYIFYSLGNFVFNQGWENTKYGIVVKVESKKNVSFKYIKIQQDYAPKIIDKNEVPHHLQLEELNNKISKYENLEKYAICAQKGLASHRKYNHRSIVRNIFRNDKLALIGIMGDYIKRHLHI